MTAVLRFNDVVFSFTHAEFAAGLLDDCRAEFLCLTSALDFDVERALRGPRRQAAPAAYTPGNRDTLIASAAYAQWISDQIRQQSTRWRAADRAAAAGYATRADELALQQRQLAEAQAAADSFAGVGLSVQPPPLPGELESIATLPAPYLMQLDRAREWCGQAAWAAGMSNTGGMITAGQHIRALLSCLSFAVWRVWRLLSLEVVVVVVGVSS